MEPSCSGSVYVFSVSTTALCFSPEVAASMIRAHVWGISDDQYVLRSSLFIFLPWKCCQQAIIKEMGFTDVRRKLPVGMNELARHK